VVGEVELGWRILERFLALWGGMLRRSMAIGIIDRGLLRIKLNECIIVKFVEETLKLVETLRSGHFFQKLCNRGNAPRTYVGRTGIDKWLCNTAPEVLKFIESPIFQL